MGLKTTNPMDLLKLKARTKVPAESVNRLKLKNYELPLKSSDGDNIVLVASPTGSFQ
jgi:hypothetical protein